jgi:hypothetical protein
LGEEEGWLGHVGMRFDHVVGFYKHRRLVSGR